MSTITGASWSDHLNNTHGPFVNGANLYAVLVDKTNNKIRCYKSTNGGTSFAEVDSAHAPASSTTANYKSVHVVQSGTTLWCYKPVSSASMTIEQFSMATDLWGTQIAGPTITLNTNVSGTAALFGARRSDGSHVVLYNGATEAVMATNYRRVKLHYRSAAGVWNGPYDVVGSANGAAANTLPGTSAFHDLGVIVLGASDRVHAFYRDSAAIAAKQRTFNASNVFPAATDTALNQLLTGSAYPYGQPTTFVSGGSTVLRIPYTQDIAGGPGNLVVLSATDADSMTLTGSTASDTTAESVTANGGAVAANGGTLYAIFSPSSNDDLYDDNDAGTGTWGTDVLLATGTVQGVNAADVTGAASYIAVLYNDAGVVTYLNAVSLATGTNHPVTLSCTTTTSGAKLTGVASLHLGTTGNAGTRKAAVVSARSGAAPTGAVRTAAPTTAKACTSTTTGTKVSNPNSLHAGTAGNAVVRLANAKPARSAATPGAASRGATSLTTSRTAATPGVATRPINITAIRAVASATQAVRAALPVLLRAGTAGNAVTRMTAVQSYRTGTVGSAVAKVAGVGKASLVLTPVLPVRLVAAQLARVAANTTGATVDIHHSVSQDVLALQTTSATQTSALAAYRTAQSSAASAVLKTALLARAVVVLGVPARMAQPLLSRTASAAVGATAVGDVTQRERAVLAACGTAVAQLVQLLAPRTAVVVQNAAQQVTVAQARVVITPTVPDRQAAVQTLRAAQTSASADLTRLLATVRTTETNAQVRRAVDAYIERTTVASSVPAVETRQSQQFTVSAASAATTDSLRSVVHTATAVQVAAVLLARSMVADRRAVSVAVVSRRASASLLRTVVQTVDAARQVAVAPVAFAATVLGVPDAQALKQFPGEFTAQVGSVATMSRAFVVQRFAEAPVLPALNNMLAITLATGVVSNSLLRARKRLRFTILTPTRIALADSRHHADFVLGKLVASFVDWKHDTVFTEGRLALDFKNWKNQIEVVLSKLGIRITGG